MQNLPAAPLTSCPLVPLDFPTHSRGNLSISNPLILRFGIKSCLVSPGSLSDKFHNFISLQVGYTCSDSPCTKHCIWKHRSCNRLGVRYRACLALSSILEPRCLRLNPRGKSRVCAITESTEWHCYVVVSSRQGVTSGPHGATGVTAPWAVTHDLHPVQTRGGPRNASHAGSPGGSVLGSGHSEFRSIRGALGIFEVKCQHGGQNKNK